MQEELAPDCGRMHRLGLLHEVENNETITIYTGHRCLAITSDAVSAQAPDGTTVEIPADWVVMAAGMRARTDEVMKLRPLVKEFYAIGDCKTARTVMKAVREAHDAAVDLGL